MSTDANCNDCPGDSWDEVVFHDGTAPDDAQSDKELGSPGCSAPDEKAVYLALRTMPIFKKIHRP